MSNPHAHTRTLSRAHPRTPTHTHAHDTTHDTARSGTTHHKNRHASLKLFSVIACVVFAFITATVVVPLNSAPSMEYACASCQRPIKKHNPVFTMGGRSAAAMATPTSAFTPPPVTAMATPAPDTTAMIPPGIIPQGVPRDVICELCISVVAHDAVAPPCP